MARPVAGIIGGLSAVLALSGCASQMGPEVLTISSEHYEATFDAAVDAARREGLTAVLRDRRGGIIETDARVAGSLLEPWRIDNASLSQATANTVAYQRRRARFEFTPAGFAQQISQDGTAIEETTSDPLVVESTDITQTSGEMELRVWVYVERASTPGLRRGTWSRRTTTTTGQPTGGSETVRTANLTSGTQWTTVARDTAYERRLLSQIQSNIGR